tara:strand:- start:482 stop:670 length:189 start_codon:yes stop_codon:yes gene_type:complete
MDESFLDKVLYSLIMFILLVGFFAFMDNDPDAPKEAVLIIMAAIPITVLRWAITGKHFWNAP